MIAHCTGVVLAGGLSTRMGHDKALLVFDGKPLVLRAVDTLRSFFEEVIVVTNSPETAAAVDVPTVGDVIPQQGPLSGIHAGLVTMNSSHGFFVACDMPFLNVEFIRYLVELAVTLQPGPPPHRGRGTNGFDVVAPRIDGQVEGMHSVYSKNCIKPIENVLSEGKRKLIGFYDAVRTCYVEREECARFDPQLRMFENVNTPQELEECTNVKRKNVKRET